VRITDEVGLEPTTQSLSSDVPVVYVTCRKCPPFQGFWIGEKLRGFLTLYLIPFHGAGSDELALQSDQRFRCPET
jgi:hypothetical protein